MTRDRSALQFIQAVTQNHFYPAYVSVLSVTHFKPRSKSQRRRFEEELNERMIRTIDGINSQK